MNNQKQVITVTVDGGYNPSTIDFKKGVPAELKFVWTSDRGCLGTIQSDDMNFQAKLPLEESVSFNINTDQAGEFKFNCGMNMVSGKVVIK